MDRGSSASRIGLAAFVVVSLVLLGLARWVKGLTPGDRDPVAVHMQPPAAGPAAARSAARARASAVGRRQPAMAALRAGAATQRGEPGLAGGRSAAWRGSERAAGSSAGVGHATVPSPQLSPERTHVRVRGRVTSDDGRELAGVVIEVPALRRGTMTDARGRYELLLPAGRHELHIARLDHAVLRRIIVVPVSQAPIVFDWRLQRQDLHLPPVVVRAARHRQAGAPPPGQHVLLGEDVQQHIGAFEDVMRVVQSLPSVGSASDYHGEFFVRGAGAHANSIYLDGIPIFFPYHILGFNSIFNPGIVESAEFFAGGAPAAYGGATGGVLLVRSHGAHAPDHRGDAGLSYVSAHVRAAGGDARQGWVFSLRRSYFDQLVRWLDRQNSSQMPSFYDGMLRVRWQPVAGHLLIGGLLVAGDGLSIPGPEASALRHDLIRADDGAGAAGALATSRDRLALDNRLTVAALTWRAVLGPHAWLETVLGYVPQRLGFSLMGDNDESVHIESRTLALRQDLTWQRVAHRLRFGVEAYQARSVGLVSAYAAFLSLRQSNAALNVADQKERYRLDLGATRRFLALYGQDDWSLAGNEVQLGIGLRYERDELARQQRLSPRLSLALQPRPSWRLHGTWGVAHALHSTPLELQPTRTGAALGAERAIEATVGVTRHAGEVRGGVSAYVKRFDDLVYEAEPAYFANGGRGRAHGLESWLECAPHPRLAVRLQYVWSRTEQRDALAWRRRWTTDAASGQRLWGPVYEEPYWYRPLQDQRHRFAVDGRFRHRAWEFGVHVQLASGLPYTPVIAVEADDVGRAYGIVGRKGSAQLPAYQRLDLRVLRHFEHESVDWRIFAEVLNVTAAENVYMQRWNRDYTQQYSVTMLPLLPTVGIEASF